MQHEIYVELCEEAKKTVEDNNMRAKLRMSMYGLSSPKKFEMSCARRRFRCARRTRGSGLGEKRVGVEANTTKLRVKILDRTLCWYEGVGISYEADQKHAEAIIRETGASNLTSLKILMSKENREEVRDKTSDIVEERK